MSQECFQQTTVVESLGHEGFGLAKPGWFGVLVYDFHFSKVPKETPAASSMYIDGCACLSYAGLGFVDLTLWWLIQAVFPVNLEGECGCIGWDKNGILCSKFPSGANHGKQQFQAV